MSDSPVASTDPLLASLGMVVPDRATTTRSEAAAVVEAPKAPVPQVVTVQSVVPAPVVEMSGPKRRRGRPPKPEEHRTRALLGVLLHPKDQDVLRQMAKARNMSVSRLVRTYLKLGLRKGLI